MKALEKLPTTGQFAPGAEQRQPAEERLVRLATDHDAKALTVLGSTSSKWSDSDVAERYDSKALEAPEEAAALRRTFLEMREDDEGTCHGKFRIPALHGQILSKFVLALLTGQVHGHRHPTTTCPRRCATGLASASTGVSPRQVPPEGRQLLRPPSWSR